MISAVRSWVLPSLALVSALTLVAWQVSALALVWWPSGWSSVWQDTPLTWLAHLGKVLMGWDRNTGERGREVALSLVRGLLSPRVTVSRDVAVCLQVFDEACGDLVGRVGVEP